MERILVLLVALFSISAFSAVPGNAPIVCIGAPGQQTASLCLPISQLSTSPQQVFSLYGGASATANSFYILYGGPGTAGTYSGPGQAYRVTTGKVAYCMNMTGTSGGANNVLQFFSATASFTQGQSTALTGPLYMGGATTFYPMVTGAIGTPVPLPGTYQFGASTFAGFQPGSSSTYFIHLDCFEQ